jgi:ethanolamine utilization microcompartment shell protein EutL
MGRVGILAMDEKWSVLAALKAAREQLWAGAGDGAISAMRALRREVPAPVRDQAYYALMDAATSTGGQPSIGMLAQPREATLALFDAAIKQLTAKLH